MSAAHSPQGEDRSISKNAIHNTGSVFKCSWDKTKLRTHVLKEGMKIGMLLSSSSFSLHPIFVLKIMGLLPGAQRPPEKSLAVGQVRETLVLSGQKWYWSALYSTLPGKVASTGYPQPKSLRDLPHHPLKHHSSSCQFYYTVDSTGYTCKSPFSMQSAWWQNTASTTEFAQEVPFHHCALPHLPKLHYQSWSNASLVTTEQKKVGEVN